MALNLETFTKENENQGSSLDLLKSYLGKVLTASDRKEKYVLDSEINKEIKENPSYVNDVKMEDIKGMSSAIASGTKAYGLKAKLNYAFNGESINRRHENLKNNPKNELGTTSRAIIAVSISSFVGSFSSLPLMAVMENNDTAAIAGVSLGAAALVGYTMKEIGAFATRSKSPVQAELYNDYTQLKHAQIALKKMKEAILKDQAAQVQAQKDAKVAELKAIKDAKLAEAKAQKDAKHDVKYIEEKHGKPTIAAILSAQKGR